MKDGQRANFQDYKTGLASIYFSRIKSPAGPNFHSMFLYLQVENRPLPVKKNVRIRTDESQFIIKATFCRKESCCA